jgi:hypothetical protein
MKLGYLPKILVIALVTLFSANTAFAAFGISPSQVINYNLLQGSHYEQKISLVRSDASKEAKAEVAIYAPEIGSWLTIDKGLSFVFSEGERQVWITVNVDVPEDAELGNYKGTIALRVVPEQIEEPGVVTIALGAQINVDLDVVEKKFFDFIVRSLDIPDLEEGSPIKVLLKVENVGNLEGGPDKVHLDVYDNTGQSLLESGDETSLDTVKPFEIKEIFAEFPTELGVGQHWGEVKVYKGEEIAREEKLFFSIIEKSTFPVLTEEIKGWFQNLFSGPPSLYLYIGAGVIFLVALILLIWAERKRRKLIAKVLQKRKLKPDSKKEK